MRQWLQRLTVAQKRPLDERHEGQEHVEAALPAPLTQPLARLRLFLHGLEDGRLQAASSEGSVSPNTVAVRRQATHRTLSESGTRDAGMGCGGVAYQMAVLGPQSSVSGACESLATASSACACASAPTRDDIFSQLPFFIGFGRRASQASLLVCHRHESRHVRASPRAPTAGGHALPLSRCACNASSTQVAENTYDGCRSVVYRRNAFEWV